MTVVSRHSSNANSRHWNFGAAPSKTRPLNNTFGFAQTHTPYELNVLTLAQTARFKTERYFVNPEHRIPFDLLTKLRGEYGYSKDIFNGGPEINSNIFTLGVDRRVGLHDLIGLMYVGRYFTFGGDFTGFTPGFLAREPRQRDLTCIALELGPRFYDRHTTRRASRATYHGGWQFR